MIRLSAIGDAVHAMPVAASLRDAWPEARISWVIQPAAHGLMRGIEDVDEFIVVPRSRRVATYREFRRSMRGRRFDLLLDMHAYLKAGLFTALTPADRKVGFDRARARELNWLFTTERIPAHPPSHVQDQYFEFVRYLGVDPVRRWDFSLTEEETAAGRAFFDRLDRPALSVVLRSSRAEKDWPIERYARLIEIAEGDLGLRAVLVGSGAPAELALAEDVVKRTRATPVNALGDGLRRLAGLLDGSALVVSPDTGPLHMAVALNTPTIGLYGATDPKRSGPYERFPELTIDRYTQPGEREPSREIRRGHMDRIQVADVAEKLELAVRRYPPVPGRAMPS